MRKEPRLRKNGVVLCYVFNTLLKDYPESYRLPDQGRTLKNNMNLPKGKV